MRKIKLFLERYNLVVLFAFAILTMQTYVFETLSTNNTSGVIYRGIVAIIIMLYSVLFIMCFRFKPSKIFVIFASIYIISSIISLWVNAAMVKFSFSAIQYLASISTIMVNTISIYLFISNRNFDSGKNQYVFLFAFIIFVVLLCLYTYIFQYNNIYETFTNEYGWNYDVTSIFYVKTIYGFFLTTGSFYSSILWAKTKKTSILLLPLFFFLNAIISRSKTSILVIGLLILFLICNLLIDYFKKDKKKFILLVLSISLFVILVITLTFTIDFLHQFLRGSIFNDGVVVIKARFEKWKDFLTNFTNPFNIVFGYGERISRNILGNHNTSDNIYLYSLATGGLIKLAIHFVLIFYLIKYAKKSCDLLMLILIILTLVSGLFEENYIYGFNVTSLGTAPLLFGMIQTKHNEVSTISNNNF